MEVYHQILNSCITSCGYVVYMTAVNQTLLLVWVDKYELNISIVMAALIQDVASMTIYGSCMSFDISNTSGH